MSKKMMKRSLALGALMAFVITGSAMAAEKTVGISNNTTHKNNDAAHVFVKNSELLELGSPTYNVSGNGIHITGAQPGEAINSNGVANLHAGLLTINTTNGGNGIYTVYGGQLTLGVDDGLYITSSGHGINSGTSANSTITINAEKTMVSINAAENAIDSRGNGTKIEITGKNVILESQATGEGATDASKGHAVISRGVGSKIKIAATNDLTITAKKGKNAVYASGSGSKIELDANNVVSINGKVKAQASQNGSTVKLGGKMIKVNGNSGETAVHAANGVGSNGDSGKWVDDPRTATVYLGDANTERIEIVTDYIGIGANYNGSTVNVKANNVFITDSTGNDTWAVYAMNGADYADSDRKDNAKVVFEEGTNLTVDLYKLDSNGEKVADGDAIVALSQASIDLGGNVIVNAKNAIYTRGEAIITVNESGNNIVQLNGDILFDASANDRIDSDVTVNLKGAESFLNGRIYTSSENNTDGRVNGMKLGLSKGATWNVTGNSFVNELNGSGGNIVFDANAKDVHIDAGSASLNLTMAGETADDFNTADDLTTVAQRLGVSEDATETISAKVVMAEGDVKGETTGVVTYDTVAGEDGYYHGLVTEVTEKVNTKNQAIGDAGISLKLHWRSHINDMNKRMGELRNAEGEHGVWARMVRGESEYKNTKAQYNQYQLGYDEKLSVDKRWTVGAAVTFAEGDANYGQGSTEDKSTAFAIYGSKLNNDGTFVDLIARYAHLESDLDDANSGKGDYATNGMSVSAEFGKRIQQGNGLWIEPQVELTYGTVDSAEFQLGQKTVTVGDMDSLIGRVGFSLGKDIKQGNVYARASYLYDFDGETENAFSNGIDSRTIAEDLGGGWWEVGVGANINLSKATYIYADVEKTFGGEVDTNWQWNLGVRYSF